MASLKSLTAATTIKYSLVLDITYTDDGHHTFSQWCDIVRKICNSVIYQSQTIRFIVICIHTQYVIEHLLSHYTNTLNNFLSKTWIMTCSLCQAKNYGDIDDASRYVISIFTVCQHLHFNEDYTLEGYTGYISLHTLSILSHQTML